MESCFMAPADFVHLRVHTAYSLSEGALKIDDLASLCRAEAMPEAPRIPDRGASGPHRGPLPAWTGRAAAQSDAGDGEGRGVLRTLHSPQRWTADVLPLHKYLEFTQTARPDQVCYPGAVGLNLLRGKALISQVFLQMVQT